MKKVSRTSPSRGVTRPQRPLPAIPRPVRHFKPRFGPDPVPQPLLGRFGLRVSALQIRRRRLNPVQRRAGKGAAAPLRFVFVRRLKTIRRGASPRSAAPVSTPIQIRKVVSRIRDAKRGSKPDLSPPLAPQTGASATGGLPWVEQLMAAQMDPESIPQGLPEMPLILLEGDPVVLEPPSQQSEQDSPAMAVSASAVWLTGCDPRTLLLGWEEPSEHSGSMASPTEWRLRSLAEPDSILAAGALPEDRRFLFLLDPPQAAGHIADIGVRSPEGRWKCLASSGPVSLPPSSVAAESSPAIVPLPSSAGFRPEVSASYFHQILEPQRRFAGPAGSSELGLPAVSGQLGHGATYCGAPSSDVNAAIPLPGNSSSALGAPDLDSGLPPEDFWFRVNAEVVLFGSSRPGSRVTIFGRPVELRPDGSFTFRCALPDGRFEVPIQAVCPQGGDVRKANLTLARQTLVQGVVGSHPPTLGLPLPDAIP
jgi:hypothetical protein